MATLTPSTLNDLLYRALDLRFQAGLEAAPSYLMEASMMMPSDGDSNVYGWMDHVPTVREWIGERQVQNLVAQEYRLTNKDYELTVEVDRNKIDDQQVALYGPAFEMMGRQAAVWPDLQLHTALAAGGTATTFDAVAFFSATHPIDTTGQVSGTQSNTSALALSAANYATVLAQGKSMKGRDGQIIGAFATAGGVRLYVGAALEKTAREILNGEFISVAGGSTQTNVWQNSASLIVDPRLNSTEWYLFDVSMPIKPLIWQERKSPELTQKTAPDEDNVFWRNKLVYGFHMRGVAGYGLYYFAQRGNV